MSTSDDLRRQVLANTKLEKSFGRKGRSRHASRQGSREVSPNGQEESPRSLRASRQASRNVSRTVSRNASRNASPAPDGDSASDDRESLTTASNSDDDDFPITIADIEDAEEEYNELKELKGNNSNVSALMSAWEPKLRKLALERSADRILEASESARSRKRDADKIWKRLRGYSYLAIITYAPEVLEAKSNDLCASFLQTARSAENEETLRYSFTCLDITMITAPESVDFEAIVTALMAMARESEDISHQTHALQSLGLSCIAADLTDDMVDDLNTFYMETISGDGFFEDAINAPNFLATAITSYGLYISTLEDFSDDSRTVAGELLEHLGSSNLAVSMASAEVLGLLYEMSFVPFDQTNAKRMDYNFESDLSSGQLNSEVIYDGDHQGTPRLIRSYEAFQRRDVVEQKLKEYAQRKNHQISKRERRVYTQTMVTALQTLHNPLKPLSNLPKSAGLELPPLPNEELPRRANVWPEFFRLQRLKELLRRQGLEEHADKNPLVQAIFENAKSGFDESLNTNGVNQWSKGQQKLKAWGPGKFAGWVAEPKRENLEIKGFDYYNEG